MAIHVAITRKVLPGKEEEFKDALRRFLGDSFLHGGVHGASMMTALPGSESREIGILRTFADQAERDAFYNSKLFKDWEAYASTLTEEPVYRELTGLEAWFRSPVPPPRWKMAVATLCGVYPTSLQVKLCTSSLVLDKGKIFMLAVFQTERQQQQLDQDIIAEASLSLDYPIIVSVGIKRYTIGSKDEYLYKRLAIQAAVRRKRKAMPFMNQNSRRQLRKTSIDNLIQSEKRYVSHKQHVYSKRLIDLCLKNKAATLLLVDQTEKEQQAKEDPFLFRNWGYYGLKQKIERKAEKVGIVVLVE